MPTIKRWVRDASTPLARALVAAGVSANALTLLGFLLNVAAGLIVARGDLVWGGVVYLLVSCFDFLDGAVARLSGSAGPFGAFFDSVLDRGSEAGVLVGLVYWYAARQEPLFAALAAAALAGSFLVSYARARAEGLGLDCEVGLFQRPERIVLLGLALTFSFVGEVIIQAALIILCLVTAVTTVQRISHVAALTSGPPSQRAG